MIKAQYMTPKVYYDKSRDFQTIGRLFDIVLNSVKTDSDMIYSMPIGDNTDIALITLLSTTLGFIPKHKYNSKQLSAICNVLNHIVKYKGSINSITIAVNAILNAEGITDYLDYKMDREENMLTLYLPDQLKDLTLLKDIMDYITPAGLGYNMVKEFKETKNISTTITTSDIWEVVYKDADKKDLPLNTDLSILLDKDTLTGENAPIKLDVGAKPGVYTTMTILTKEEIEKMAKGDLS